VAAIAAFAGGIVFEKFYRVIASRALYIKNCTGLPILGVLPWAFHGGYPFVLNLKLIGSRFFYESLSDRIIYYLDLNQKLNKKRALWIKF
jgi:hypothetical protein